MLILLQTYDFSSTWADEVELPLNRGEKQRANLRVPVIKKEMVDSVLKKTGASNPADFLPRKAPPENKEDPENDREGEEEFARMATKATCHKALTLNDIRQATQDDDELRKDTEALSNNAWKLFLQDTNQWHPVEKSQLLQL
ncbi:hypothetical protein NDU88_008990 [Pleurodeles waltl]|uniref:Uncharacterized protein n=1 Tax=Pleurodeles waltl TaxID=8319 RepID=A0AAV7PUS8_PLEWA|nr:hypothetical protein NDU88_008990 [Pleurodeles waltl]